MRQKLIMGEECPQCDAIISLDEWQFERCGCCGYPDRITDEDDELEDDEGAYAEDDLEDYGDPNDSRNL
jgi:Zn ribbon nucleic-acid-binding protein